MTPETPDGPPRPITHRRVLNIAVPIVISNATIPILGAVDTGVVGQLGEAAPIGAVGAGAIILTAFYWVFGFLRMGTAGLTSQARGEGDSAEVAALLSRAMLIAAVAGVLLIALQWPLFTAALWVSPASAGVEDMARSYMAIRIWAAPAAIGLYGLTGWLIAHERTRAVLVIQVWMNGLNILLDLWFVLGLGWGVEGVAFATFIAEWSGLAVALWFCRDALRSPAARAWARIFDGQRLPRFVEVGADILVRSLLLEAIFVSFLLLGGRFGDVALAANQILLQFLHITAYAMDGFAFAAEALVGNAMGRRSPSRVRRASVMTGIWGAGIVVVLALVFGLFGPALVDLMSTAADVRIEARQYLIYMVLAPLLGCAAWMLDGIFIGATRTADMRNMMLVSFLIYAACAALLVPLIGNHGLWISLLVSFVARGVTLGLRYPALEASAAR